MKKTYLISYLLTMAVCVVACNSIEVSDDVTIETNVDNIEEIPAVKNPEATVIAPGDYVEYHPNGGIKIKGIYSETLTREGLWISYYDNGIKWSESYYSNGKLDGHSLTFYPNGKIRYLGEYKNDEKTGTWTFYDEVGNITNEEKY